MILRPYQQRAVHELRQKFAQGHRSVLCVMPTGAGKAVCGAEVTRLSLQRGNTSLFLLPRIELLNQEVRKLKDAGITEMRVIQADRDEGPPDAKVVVASIPTLTAERWRESVPKADLVNVDEAHHAKAQTHERLLRQYPNAKIVGWSATPQRGDGRSLGDMFEALVVGVTVKELIDLGALVPCKLLAPPRILSTRELALDPVDAYEQHVKGQKAIVFCSTVAAARNVSARFVARGISAAWVSGDSSDREETIARFSKRDFNVLVNVSLVIEGFDDPESSAGILARRFTHVGSYLQALGRFLRPFPGKQRATVVDLCGSALVHGTPDLEREYTLTGKGISSQRQPIRQCQECGGVFAGSAPSCAYCGFKLPALTRAQQKALGIKLEEVTNQRKPTSWPMRAKRRGLCASCGGPVEQGAWIVYSSTSKQAMHTGCAARQARRAA